MNDLIPVEYQNQRILTTEQLAEVYETESRRITENFQRNQDHFILGKHYYLLQGEQLREFKSKYAESVLPVNKFASQFYLWTERGANRHCKILDTDKAWEQFDNLEETYFNTKGMLNLPKSLPEALRLAADMAEKNEKLLLENNIKNQIICELQPKATYYDLILQSKSALSVSQIAKDYGMSATKMNILLHDLKIQYKQGKTWLLYQPHAGMGYTVSKTHPYIDSNGDPDSSLRT